MLAILVIPFAILGCTLIVYFMMEPAFKQYLESLENKTSSMQRISILITSSNLINFFSRSDASKIVETLLKGSKEDPELLEDELMELGNSATGEIRDLYQEVLKGYEPLEQLARVKVASTFLRIVVLFYGVSVSISETVLIYLRHISAVTQFSALNGFIFGGTMVSSAIVAFIIVYIVKASRRINGNFARLETDSLPSI